MGELGCMSYRGFTYDVRNRVKDRDGWACVECGCDEVKVLEVHHIDGDKDNQDLGNLVTLCRGCHRKKHPRGRAWVTDFLLGLSDYVPESYANIK